ncbi:MAG: Ppx/GppA family phosphatase, partial [Mariprofundaceae bacterium]|nr:Ppx/GppA family phosphatase [Mariprofundaceae bacterium]
MSNFAAIDIGSNTFRLMIAKAALSNHITPWHIQAYTHRIVRLGEGLHDSDQLCGAAMLRAFDAFHAFADTLRQHDVDAKHTYAVATAAMREASNGQHFCQQVLQQTGIQINIIQGHDEANMSLLGSCAVLPQTTCDDFLLFDIGGGSTEFVRAKQGQCLDAISRKLGVVRLVEAHLHTDPPSADDYHAMCQTCQEHLADVETHWMASQGHQTTPP